MSSEKPWAESMPDSQFEFMQRVLAAPSPVGLEGAMTYGVLKPRFEEIKLDGWKVHQYRANAGIVLDTHPGDEDRPSIMFIGHADKIRLQVRSIGEDGKIWINSDSFLPATLIGHEVQLFCQNPDEPGSYRVIEGGTVEALGAIHFAPEALRSGSKGIRREMLYLELQVYGDNKRKQIEALGVRAGDTLILKRRIKRGFSPDTFYGAYLDNGLGCFVTAEAARLVAERGGTKNLRCLFAIATHEEIGRMGSRVLARALSPDILIAVDVNHDYDAAPGVKDKRYTPLKMGKGFTYSVGSATSEQLNAMIEMTALEHDIPMQRDVVGRDTGTDAMAAIFASLDAAMGSIGFPIRNMHTISETGHTGDILAAIHVLAGLIERLDTMNDGRGVTPQDFQNTHPRLDQASALGPYEPPGDDEAE